MCPDCAARALDPASADFMAAVREGVGLAFKQAGTLAAVIAVDCAFHVAFGLLESSLLPDSKPFRPGGGALAAFAQGMLLRLAVLMTLSVLESFLAAAIDGIQFVNLAEAVRGESRPLGGQVSTALRRYPPMLAVNLLSNVGMGLLMSLCCVPGGALRRGGDLRRA